MTRPHDVGSITAEYALAMPVLVILAGAILTMTQVCVVQLQCIDAARMAGRQLARGEPSETVIAQVQQQIHRDSRVDVVQAAGRAQVQVRRSFGLFLPGRPTLEVVGRAEVQLESAIAPDVSAPGTPAGQ